MGMGRVASSLRLLVDVAYCGLTLVKAAAVRSSVWNEASIERDLDSRDVR